MQFNIQVISPKIRRVTFANGPVNVVGADTIAELSDVIDVLSTDTQVQVVIFDSATPGYFYNHADLSQFDELLSQHTTDGTPLFIDVATRLASAPFVSIASIRGRTRGGGDDLTLAFDLRYASREQAIFSQPEVGTGLLPGGGAGDRLPSLVGRDRALEILLTSADYDAATAERFGWVTRALPDADLDRFVESTAARVAAFDADAVRGVKSIVNRASLPPQGNIRDSWAAFTTSATWPGFQARGAVFANIFAEIGVEEVERNLGHYLAQTV
jgi:enoyl-CoA hydratase/carnithine racemase